MKKTLVLCVVVAVLSAAVWAVEAKKGEEMTMTGTLSCSFCKLAGGPDHKCSKECCQACLKGGDTALLQDDKGGLFMLVSKDKEKPVINPERLALMGEKVNVKGIMVKANGLQAIYVENIEKAAETKAAEKK